MLGTEEVSAETVILQSSSLVYMIPSGLGVAATSLVGNALGAQRRALSIQLSNLSLQSTLVIEVIVAVCVYTWGENFINMCTPDETVRRLASANLPFLSAFTIVDGLQVVASGILRGAGRQTIGAILNVVAFYGIGLPMAYLFCFKAEFGVNGLVFGISIGAAFQVSVLLYLILVRESYVFSITTVVEEAGPTLPIAIAQTDDPTGRSKSGKT
jgi:MATE family multidrug resistance protein